MVGNRECNTERGFKNQLYIELGCLADQAASENLLLLKMVALCFHEQHFVSSFSLLFSISAKKLNNIKVRKKIRLFTFFLKI